MESIHFDTVFSLACIFPGGGGGVGNRGRWGVGRHSGSEGGRTRVTDFAEEGVFLKPSACPRFCKRSRCGSTPICINACASINHVGASIHIKVHRSTF